MRRAHAHTQPLPQRTQPALHPQLPEVDQVAVGVEEASDGQPHVCGGIYVVYGLAGYKVASELQILRALGLLHCTAAPLDPYRVDLSIIHIIPLS
jgi:hypothetical protein